MRVIPLFHDLPWGFAVQCRLRRLHKAA